jgi:hypothetical protein
LWRFRKDWYQPTVTLPSFSAKRAFTSSLTASSGSASMTASAHAITISLSTNHLLSRQHAIVLSTSSSM